MSKRTGLGKGLGAFFGDDYDISQTKPRAPEAVNEEIRTGTPEEPADHADKKANLEEMDMVLPVAKKPQKKTEPAAKKTTKPVQKVKIVEDIFAEKISAEFVGLLRLIVEKGHFAKVDTVLDYFIDCVKEYKNIGTAYVTSAMELSEAQKAAVEKRLLETTKYVKFEMHYAVDSALIGGMVIRIGDRVVDSSVRTKLNDLTRELSKIQLKAGECAS